MTRSIRRRLGLHDLDHLVFATPDLDLGVRAIRERLGVDVEEGGRHIGLGTRNVLISLGPTAYLEVIGPDPEQPAPARPRPFGIDRLREPRLVTWAVRASDIEERVRSAQGRGVDLGTILPLSRLRPDGTTLSWRMTAPDMPHADGIVPFLIDWGDTRHPASDLPACCTLVEIRAVHPRADAVRRELIAVGIALQVEQGSEARAAARSRRACCRLPAGICSSARSQETS